MSEQGAKYMTQAEYARHRDVSRATVNEYKAKGYLVLTEHGLVDRALSDDLLAHSLDARGGDRSSTAKKPSAEQLEIHHLKIQSEKIKVARQEIGLKRDAKELCLRSEVDRAAFTLARDAQEALMAIPDRLSSVLAAESDPGAIYDLLSKELRLVCNALAERSAVVAAEVAG